MPVDQAVVEGNVDKQRHDRDPQPDLDRLHRLEAVEQRVGQAEEEVGVADDAQVDHALCDDVLVVGEERERPVRRAGDHDKEEDRHRHGENQPDVDDLLDGLDLTLAPVLRADDDQALAHAHDHHLQKELDLVGEGHARERVLAVAAQHDVVREPHAVDDDVLQCDGQRQRQKRLVEVLVPAQFHPLSTPVVFFIFPASAGRCRARPRAPSRMCWFRGPGRSTRTARSC